MSRWIWLKKYGCVMAGVMAVLICIVILATNITPVVEYDVIVGVTEHKYEYGIKVSEDDTVISHIIFKDIAIGITVWASNVTIRDCIFINCSDEGIVFFHTSSGSIVEDCSFIECNDGIELQQAHNTTITNCKFIRNYHAGIDVIERPSYNVLVIDCEFDGNVMDTYGL